MILTANGMGQPVEGEIITGSNQVQLIYSKGRWYKIGQIKNFMVHENQLYWRLNSKNNWSIYINMHTGEPHEFI